MYSECYAIQKVSFYNSSRTLRWFKPDPTCFVFVGHGVHPDGVELGAGVLIQHGPELNTNTQVSVRHGKRGSHFPAASRFGPRSFWDSHRSSQDQGYLKEALVLTGPVLKADCGPTFTQRKGVTDPLRPPRGPDVRLPKSNFL